MWLDQNPETGVDEVHIDEDGSYYVFGDLGVWIKLQVGQIYDEDIPQPFCVSNGRKLRISTFLPILLQRLCPSVDLRVKGLCLIDWDPAYAETNTNCKVPL